MTDYSNLDVLIPDIKDILSHSDLNTIGPKTIRKRLAIEKGHAERGLDIDARKAELNALIEHIYADFINESSEEEPLAAKSSPVKKKRVKQDPDPDLEPDHRDKKASSPPEEDDYSSLEDDTPRKKARRTRVPKSEDDEDIARRLHAEMNGRTSRRGKTTSSKIKRKTKIKLNREPSEASKRGNAAFNMPLLTSPAVQTFFANAKGQPEDDPNMIRDENGYVTHIPRPQMVKRIWAHIKHEGLQDTTDKRMINCDDALRNLLAVERVHMFTMNKILSQHLHKPEDVSGNANANTKMKSEPKTDPEASSPANGFSMDDSE